MAVVLRERNPPKGASRLNYLSSPPRMPLEVFPGSPLAPPFCQTVISGNSKNGPLSLRKVLYFQVSERGVLRPGGLHRWLWSLEKHSD